MTRLTSFRKAQSLDKNNPEILVNLGTVYYYKKQFDSARSHLDRALELNAEEANAFNALAMVEVELKNYPKASGMLSKALSINPDDPYFLNNRGYLFLLTNQMDKAKADIDLSITLDPYNGWAYRNKGIYYLMEKRYEDAIRLLKRAESSDSFIEKIYYYLGDAYDKQHDKQHACEYYTKAVERMEMPMKEFESKCR